MSKRITITLKDIRVLKKIDEYCNFHKYSRSSVIEKIINSTAPLFSSINQKTEAVNKLEGMLFNSNYKETDAIEENEKNISLNEHIYTIWKTHILYKNLPGENRYQHVLKNSRMGKPESDAILESLKNHLEWSQAKKAIFIYTDRLVDYRGKKSGGYSNTLLVKNTEYENYYFDFNSIFSVYINDIVFLGFQGSMDKEKIYFEYQYTAFIPIYKTNEKVILIPVLDTTNITPKNTHSPDKIIINPL